MGAKVTAEVSKLRERLHNSKEKSERLRLRLRTLPEFVRPAYSDDPLAKEPRIARETLNKILADVLKKTIEDELEQERAVQGDLLVNN